VEHPAMPPPEATVKVYGLRMTRRRYIVIQAAAFFWMLALYGFWRYAGLHKSPHAYARYLDIILLAVYLYGVVETFIVLKRFKKAAKTTDLPRDGK
jgi:hypothetical protein